MSQIESANNKIECLQKQNECVKRQNDTLMLNIRDLQNHVKHFEETCFCRYRVTEVSNWNRSIVIGVIDRHKKSIKKNDTFFPL